MVNVHNLRQGIPAVVPFDVNGDTIASNSARFDVGEINHVGSLEGGGIFQTITLPSATSNLKIWVDIAAQDQGVSSNLAGGLFELLFDGMVVDSHDFGGISATATERDSLHATIVAGAGMHEVRIRMERPFTTSSESPYQFLDNVVANVADVPEPGTLAVFGLGLAGLGFARRRKAA